MTLLPEQAEGDELLPPMLREQPGQWSATLDDVFRDAAGFARDWRRLTNAGDKTKTLRLPENDVLGTDGLELQLGDNPHDDKGTLPFTGGYVEATRFRQCYGYFECEMRIASEEGVNNAFWLVSEPGAEQGNFELDVAEAKYPNEVQMCARLWSPTHIVRARTAQMGSRLSEDFHRYGMLWSPTEFRFFFDDVDTFSAENEFAHTPAVIRMSNAVAAFAGEDDGDVSGAATVFRRVRVFRNSEWAPPAPENGTAS